MVLRTLGLAAGLVGATMASQLPEFAQQYRQRLGGALDELRPEVERFDGEARAAGLDRNAALQRLASNPDALARGRADAAAQAAIRYQKLESQQRSLGEAGPFGRVAVMMSEPDTRIWGGAMRTFEPAVPVTTEGLVASLLGFIVGRGVLMWPAGLWSRARARRKPARIAVR